MILKPLGTGTFGVPKPPPVPLNKRDTDCLPATVEPFPEEATILGVFEAPAKAAVSNLIASSTESIVTSTAFGLLSVINFYWFYLICKKVIRKMKETN